MRRMGPYFSTLSTVILLCGMPALSTADTDAATTGSDNPAGIFSYAESVPDDSGEVIEITSPDRSEMSMNSGNGTVSVISSPDPTLPDDNATTQSTDSDRQIRNRQISSDQNSNDPVSTRNSLSSDVVDDANVRSSAPRDATPDESLESSMPRDARPDAGLESSMPADANPSADLESSMPADATPDASLESSRPADATPRAGLESSMPADATPDSSLESFRPAGAARLNR